jgi:hypothetical protein
VVSAGLYQVVTDQEVVRDLRDAPPTTAPIIGVDPGSLAAIVPQIVAGRLPDRGHVDRREPVGVLPVTLADRVGLGRIDDVVRRPETMAAILVPYTALADRVLPAVTPDQVRCGALISTAPAACVGGTCSGDSCGVGTGT